MVLNYDFPFPKDPDNKNDRDAVQVDAIKGVGRDSQLSVRTVNGTFFLRSAHTRSHRNPWTIGIFTSFFLLIFMANVGKYTIHGSYGYVV